MVAEQKVMVRTSERTTFTGCRQAWWWSYKERREMVGGKSMPLVFGDMAHRALAEYYIPETGKVRRRGPHPAQTFVRIFDEMNTNHLKYSIRVDDDFWMGARDLGEEMMVNYVDEWKENDKDIIIIYPEMPFQYDLYDVDGSFLCTYVGTTDAFIKRKSTGRYGLFEHKTAAAISTEHLFLDEQANTYHTIVPLWLHEQGILRNDQGIDYMLYNFLRKAQKDRRPQNSSGQYLNGPGKEQLMNECLRIGITPEELKGCLVEDLKNILRTKRINPELLGEVSKNQPPTLFHREDVLREPEARANCLLRIQQQVREMNMVRSGELPHYKSPSKNCSWCSWKDICELHENGSDWKEMKRMVTKKTDPYEMHVWALSL